MGDWEQALDQKLRQDFSAIYLDLARPTPQLFDAHPNILVGYLSFPEWLGGVDGFRWRGTDRDLANGLRTDVASYLARRKTHMGQVVDQLKLIQKWQTGRALIAELQGARLATSIKPYFFQSDFGWNAVTKPEVREAAFAKSCADEPGTGVGSDATVFYSADMWDPYQAPADAPKLRAKKASLPGYHADEVLFHELVHATRDMAGLSCPTEMDRYDNLNEFFAIVITNIYLSEKKSDRLVGALDDDDPHIVLKDVDSVAFLDHPQGRNVWPRPLMEQFKNEQRGFYDRLAAIGYDQRTDVGPKHNPVRRYEEEDKAIRAHFQKLQRLGANSPRQ